ncbi:MAG TPA: hypothetical protein VM094_02060 [Gemmatimonadales bacterium]|nr:hypothetical protein [Gemmatimonadales bacterium]
MRPAANPAAFFAAARTLSTTRALSTPRAVSYTMRGSRMSVGV